MSKGYRKRNRFRNRIGKDIRLRRPLRRIVFLVPFAVILVLFVIVWKEVFATKLPFNVVVANSDGSMELEAFDFVGGTTVDIYIPSNVQVDLARQRGVLTTHAIWKLVETENLPGQFMADSIMRTFKFPVDYWVGANGKNNLPWSKRLQRDYYMKFRPVTKIDLTDTNYLLESTLADGSDGYLVKNDIPLVLASVLADERISSGQTAVQLVNRTGANSYDLYPASGVLETLGAKVAPIASKAPENIDCIVYANDKAVLARIAGVLGCDEGKTPPKSLDIEIVFGKQFVNRF